MTDREAREKSVFLQAIEIASAAEQAAYLDAACGTDTPLRAQVESLLQVHRKPPCLSNVAEAARRANAAQPLSERHGTVIGPYKLLQQIGEGGMGTVFMAEQTQPVQRKVALKIIKAGMDSKQVIIRFEAERQALALMDHVNIARVLDAGATEAGRPYFVMELVHGVPITQYCDDNRLTPRERLELFVPVCQAIQHAHQKGIIHRDVKPSNVMITLYNGKPVPKVIDFGLAKATEQRLTERTLFTQYGTLVGTLEYMSPEQADMSALGADTRSDIYSLGVLLYELLTGSTPLSHKRLKEAKYSEILRMIKEEAPRPSKRLSDSGETLASISAQRRMEPAQLTKLVRGELDWIVMKTLEKDRNHRYETANDLARDIERYLHDEPVLACPPSALYRFRKFTRRNTASLVTAGLVAAALVLGTAGSIWQAVRATHAEVQAEIQRNLAQENANEAERQTNAVVAREKALRRYFYAADMKLAWQAWHNAWNNGNLDQLRSLLARHEPHANQEDLRSFTWYYLKGLCGHPPRATLAGHAGKVYHLAISPDGKTLASASQDTTAKLWDLATAQVRHTLRGHAGEVNCVAFAPDGKTVATASDDRTVKFWDPVSGQEQSTGSLIRFSMPVHRLEFSSDGKLLLTGELSEGQDALAATLWELSSLQQRLRMDGHFPLAFSPDAKVLATTSHDMAVRLWDVAGVHERACLRGHTSNVESGVFSPDGRTLATSSYDGTVRLWDFKSLLSSLQRWRYSVHCVAYSPDGKLLAASDEDGAVYLWETSGEQLTATFGGNSPRVRAVRFTPDGGTLASASDDRTVKLWDVTATHRAKAPPELPAPVTSISFSPDSELLATSIDGQNSILWNVRTGEAGAATPQDLDRHVLCVAFCPVGRLLATASSDRTVRLVDPITGDQRLALTGPGGSIGSLTFSPDGSMLVGDYDDEVRIWDTRTGKQLHALKPTGHARCPHTIAFSPDGKTLALQTGRDVQRWDLATGLLRDLRTGHKGEVNCLAYSPDGQTLATGSSDRGIKLWDTRDQEELHLSGHSGAVCSLAFSPDGRTLASAGGSDVKLWDAATEQELISLVGHTGAVRCVAFSPDGQTLATAGASADGKGAIKFWRAPGPRQR